MLFHNEASYVVRVDHRPRGNRLHMTENQFQDSVVHLNQTVTMQQIASRPTQRDLRRTVELSEVEQDLHLDPQATDHPPHLSFPPDAVSPLPTNHPRQCARFGKPDFSLLWPHRFFSVLLLPLLPRPFCVFLPRLSTSADQVL